MGFKRDIGRAALGLALLVWPALIGAAPTGEPLVVKTLPDPELRLITTSGSDEQSTLDRALDGFERAIGQATLVQRQATAVRCRSADVPASGPSRWAWEANCRYQRR